MILCSVKLQHMTVSVFLHIDVNMTEHCLILAGMKGCEVSKSFVGN